MSTATYQKVPNERGVYYRDGKKGRAYTINYRIGGKVKWERVGLKDDGYTIKFCRELRRDRIKELRGHTPTEKPLTMNEAWDHFKSIKEANGQDLGSNISRYRLHIKPLFGTRKLHTITTLELEGAKKVWHRSNLNDTTITYVIRQINSIYRKMINLELYKGPNPTENVEKKRVDRKKLRFLTHIEAQLLLDELKPLDHRLYVQTCIGLFAGLRVGEIKKLKGRHIDWERNLVHVERLVKSTKGSSRFIPMSGILKTVLSDWFDRNEIGPHDKLFTNHNKHMFPRVIEKLGFNDGLDPEDSDDQLYKVTFHTTRHTFASWLAIQGETLQRIQKLLGHATIKTTERYAHLIKAGDSDIVEKLDQGFKEQSIVTSR